MSGPDISPALYAKLLTYHPTSSSFCRTVIFDVKIHDSRKRKFYRCTRRILLQNRIQQLNILLVRCTFEFFFADFQVNSLFFQVCSCSGSTYVFRLTVRDVNYGKQHEFAVLKIKSYVSKNKVIFFDSIGHKKIAFIVINYSHTLTHFRYSFFQKPFW